MATRSNLVRANIARLLFALRRSGTQQEISNGRSNRGRLVHVQVMTSGQQDQFATWQQGGTLAP
jgi:hypothetical protein